MHPETNFSFMVAEDDPDDKVLIESAFEKLSPNANIRFVDDGEKLLGFLDQVGRKTTSSLPDVIFLDLNMPKVSGYEALKIIKNKPEFNLIHIVVLSTSREAEDIEFCKDHSVPFYSKPDDFQSLVDIIKTVVFK